MDEAFEDVISFLERDDIKEALNTLLSELQNPNIIQQAQNFLNQDRRRFLEREARVLNKSIKDLEKIVGNYEGDSREIEPPTNTNDLVVRVRTIHMQFSDAVASSRDYSRKKKKEFKKALSYGVMKSLEGLSMAVQNGLLTLSLPPAALPLMTASYLCGGWQMYDGATRVTGYFLRTRR